MRAVHLLVLGLTACNGPGTDTDTVDEDPLIDAVGDLSCYTPGDDWMTDEPLAENQVELPATLTVLDFEKDDPVAEVTIDVWLADAVSGSPDLTLTSDVNGDATGDLTSCTPYTYRTSTDPDLDETETTYEAHQIDPLPADGTIETELNSVSHTTAGLIPSILGVSVDDTKSIIAGTAYDCGEEPIEGARVVVKVDGEEDSNVVVKYFIDDFPDRDQPYTSPDGLWVAINVPPGEVEVELWAQVDGAYEKRGATVLTSNSDSINISNIHTGYGQGVKYPESCLVAAE